MSSTGTNIAAAPPPSYRNTRDAHAQANSLTSDTSTAAWIRPRRRAGKKGKGNGNGNGDGNGDDDDDDMNKKASSSFSSSKNHHHVVRGRGSRRIGPVVTTTTTSLGCITHWGRLTIRILLGATATLYVLNQKHLLPRPLSSIVSRTLFWPTLPITVSSRIGTWMTDVDDTVVIGGAPFGFVGMPERLYDDYAVRGVINMCDEYRGPRTQYDRLGMQELWLRTTDHFEPSVSDLKRAVAFIQKTEKESGGRVYVHCRAGHGRSAAVVFAWLLYKNPDQDPEELNAWLVSKRNVRKTLFSQPNIKEFHSWALRRQRPRNRGFESERNKRQTEDDENEEEETANYDIKEDETAILSEYRY